MRDDLVQLVGGISHRPDRPRARHGLRGRGMPAKTLKGVSDHVIRGGIPSGLDQFADESLQIFG
jgi:hypothetical protein